jgi:hypothetical protein
MQKQHITQLLILASLLFLGACGENNKKNENLTVKGGVEGSGAGGAIVVYNDTYDIMDVTWSGAGCFGAAEGLTLVCETRKIQPRSSALYGYNWGVTETWINVGRLVDSSGFHPCSAISPSKGACIADHKVVDTESGSTNECTVSSTVTKKQVFYSLECD